MKVVLESSPTGVLTRLEIQYYDPDPGWKVEDYYELDTNFQFYHTLQHNGYYRFRTKNLEGPTTEYYLAWDVYNEAR